MKRYVELHSATATGATELEARQFASAMVLGDFQGLVPEADIATLLHRLAKDRVVVHFRRDAAGVLCELTTSEGARQGKGAGTQEAFDAMVRTFTQSNGGCVVT